MSSHSISPIFVIGTILLSSFSGVNLALRSFEARSQGRLARTLFIWAIWLVTVGFVYLLSQFLSGPMGYSVSMSRVVLEFANLFSVGIAGMLAVFAAIKFLLWRKRASDDAPTIDFPKSSVTKASVFQKAFFINLAAIIGFAISFTIVTVFDDLYHGRFNSTKESEPDFTIYD